MTLHAAVIVWGFFDLKRRFFVNAVNRLNIKEKEVLLTFDDGTNIYTEAVIRILDEKNIKAVFFLVGKSASAHPETVKRILQSGHSLGLHTQNHSVRFTFSGIKNVRNEIENCKTTLKKITNEDTNLFRPPFGVINPVIAFVAKEMNLRVIGWSIRSLDTKITAEKPLINRITRKLKSGDIILLHDLKTTVEILPEIINEIEKKGYGFADIKTQSLSYQSKTDTTKLRTQSKK